MTNISNRPINLDYEEKPTVYYKNNRDEMRDFIPEMAINILEVGCGDGEFSARLKSTRNLNITGIEPFPGAAQVARTRLDRVLQMDVSDGIHELQGQQFDCIVCNDVLEHLVDPWETLKQLRPLISTGGALVASIPNMRFMPVLKDLVIKGDWQYTDMGVMDRTHLRFFTKNSIKSLFKDSGFQLTELKGINEIKFPWKFNLLNKLALGALSDSKFPQYACVAKDSKY